MLFRSNHGKKPLADRDDTAPLTTKMIDGKEVYNLSVDLLDGIGFSALSENHFGLGVRYGMSNGLNIGFAVNHSPASQGTMKGSTTTPAGPASYEVKTKLAVTLFVFGIDYQMGDSAASVAAPPASH